MNREGLNRVIFDLGKLSVIDENTDLGWVSELAHRASISIEDLETEIGELKDELRRVVRELEAPRPLDVKWYLQLNPDGFAFWDNYVHPDCSVELTSDKAPFREMLYTPGLKREDDRLARKKTRKKT